MTQTRKKSELLWLSVLLAALLCAPAFSASAEPVEETSSEILPENLDLHASLLTIAPGKKLYSLLGHCAIRMQAYSVNDSLDYCYTFECNASENIFDYIRFLAGEVRAHWIAVPTEDFLSEYIEHQRQITEYELPYTFKEKQLLWERLDKAFLQTYESPFNYMNSNCTQGVIRMLCQGTPPRMTIEEPKETIHDVNGKLARKTAEKSPWMKFLLISLMGKDCDGYWNTAQRTTPKTIPQIMRACVDDRMGNETMVAVEDLPKSILVAGNSFDDEKPYWLSPNLLFSVLLIVSLLMLLLNQIHVFQKLTLWFDIILFSAQGLFFLLLLWLTQVSGIFGHIWNWYLLPLVPLPIMLMLSGKKKKSEERKKVCFSYYTIFLLLFILATPLSSQLDFTHQLITASLAVRSLAHSSFFTPQSMRKSGVGITTQNSKRSKTRS